MCKQRGRQQRVDKVLEDAGIKLGSVASQTLGKSGRAMIDALIAGERDPMALAELAQRRLRSKIPELQRALVGRFGDHHAAMLKLHLAHIDHLDRLVADLDAQIEAKLVPFVDTARQSVVDRRARASSVGDVTFKEHVDGRKILAARSADRQEEGDHRDRARDHRRVVAHADQRLRLQRPRNGLVGQTIKHCRGDRPAEATPRSARPQRHPHIRSLTNRRRQDRAFGPILSRPTTSTTDLFTSEWFVI